MDFGQMGEMVKWDPSLFPHDEAATAGVCRFSPNCGGVPMGGDRMSRPDHPTCPNAPAEFAERTGMTTEGAGFERYVALCRPRAERRFGARECRLVDEEAGLA